MVAAQVLQTQPLVEQVGLHLEVATTTQAGLDQAAYMERTKSVEVVER
jgi:hypothetical protein